MGGVLLPPDAKILKPPPIESGFALRVLWLAPPSSLVPRPLCRFSTGRAKDQGIGRPRSVGPRAFCAGRRAERPSEARPLIFRAAWRYLTHKGGRGTNEDGEQRKHLHRVKAGLGARLSRIKIAIRCSRKTPPKRGSRITYRRRLADLSASSASCRPPFCS